MLALLGHRLLLPLDAPLANLTELKVLRGIITSALSASSFALNPFLHPASISCASSAIRGSSKQEWLVLCAVHISTSSSFLKSILSSRERSQPLWVQCSKNASRNLKMLVNGSETWDLSSSPSVTLMKKSRTHRLSKVVKRHIKIVTDGACSFPSTTTQRRLKSTSSPSLTISILLSDRTRSSLPKLLSSSLVLAGVPSISRLTLSSSHQLVLAPSAWAMISHSRIKVTRRASSLKLLKISPSQQTLLLALIKWTSPKKESADEWTSEAQ